MKLKSLVLAVLVSALASAAFGADMKSAPPSKELLAELRQGGFLIFFRHSLTPNYKDAIDRDQDDPRPGDCSYQRNLSAEGIDQSRALGVAFRELEIPIGIVRASPMCRTMDSAWYAFGRYERDRNILLHGTEPERDPPEGKVWKNVQNIAKIPPLPMTNSIFMSHGTIGEVFGAGYLDEGEAVIVKPDGKGAWSLIGRVKSDQWRG
jgi:hypothetical protein